MVKTGPSALSFWVDTGSNFVGLPLEDIEALGLYKIPGGRYRLMTGLGVMESDTYSASVRIGDDRARLQ